jgi:hypothetical protein
LFCHVYGRGRSADQQIPGWQYSWVAALETGASSWTAPLDMVRLGRADDLAAVTATQLRAVADRLIAAGHHQPADPDILIVADAGYDPARLAYDLTGLPVQVLGRIRADRVLCRPVPPRAPGTTGRPPKHGPVFRLDTWTWLILVVYTQLRLARTLTGDLRRPWERPARPGRVSPARVRRGFRNLHPKTSHPAGAPKPSRPGPGRPPGTPNRHPAHRHDVGKTVLRAQTLKEQRKHAS